MMKTEQLDLFDSFCVCVVRVVVPLQSSTVLAQGGLEICARLMESPLSLCLDRGLRLCFAHLFCSF